MTALGHHVALFPQYLSTPSWILDLSEWSIWENRNSMGIQYEQKNGRENDDQAGQVASQRPGLQG